MDVIPRCRRLEKRSARQIHQSGLTTTTAIPYLSQLSRNARVQPFWRRLHMKRRPDKRKFSRPKTKLGLPDLDQSKAAVLGSLRSPESQRGYRHAIDEFIEWYCSEPRLSFNRPVVLRYRMQLESRNLAPGTINVRLAAVRRLAYEAADAGLLSPELAAT